MVGKYIKCLVVLIGMLVYLSQSMAQSDSIDVVDAKVLKALKLQKQKRKFDIDDVDKKQQMRLAIRKDLAKEQRAAIERHSALSLKPKSRSNMVKDNGTIMSNTTRIQGLSNPFNPYYYQVMENLKRQKSKDVSD